LSSLLFVLDIFFFVRFFLSRIVLIGIMRIGNFIIFTVSNCCTLLMGELIVPIFRTHTDGLNWAVNTTFGDSTNIATMHLKLYWFSILPLWANSIRPSITMVGRQSDVVVSAVPSHRFTWGISSTQTNLGLEPLRLSLTCDLLGQVQSLAITHSSSTDDANMGNLVLMSTLSSFNRSCVPGTLMRLDLSRSTDYDLRRKINATVSIPNSNVTAFGNASIASFVGSRYLANIHSDIFLEIKRAAVRAGARRGNGVVMTNCFTSILDTLPSIHVMYHDSGNLVLYPDDYISFTSNTTCRILLRPQRDVSIVLDLLKIKDLNFRLSSDSYKWEICDAL